MKILNYLLWVTGGASAFSFIGWACLVAAYLINNRNSDLYYLVSSTIIWAGTFILLLVLLWLKKEMHLEEIRRDMRILDLIKQEKKGHSEEEQSRKLEELKVAVKGIISILEKREGRN